MVGSLAAGPTSVVIWELSKTHFINITQVWLEGTWFEYQMFYVITTKDNPYPLGNLLGAISGTKERSHITKRHSHYSYHLGNYKDFRSCVPGSMEEDQNTHFLFCHSLTCTISFFLPRDQIYFYLITVTLCGFSIMEGCQGPASQPSINCTYIRYKKEKGTVC